MKKITYYDSEGNVVESEEKAVYATIEDVEGRKIEKVFCSLCKNLYSKEFLNERGVCQNCVKKRKEIPKKTKRPLLRGSRQARHY